jgi:hypothetical protein
MKTIILVNLALLFSLGLKSQCLDRISLSSGGLVNDRMSINIGELFVLQLDNSNGSFEMGSLASLSSTGGLSISTIVKSIEQFHYQAICYPNPVTEQLTFSIRDLANQSIDLSILDISGKVVIKEHSNTSMETRIDVSKLSPGQYIIVLKTNDNIIIPSIKFIKL